MINLDKIAEIINSHKNNNIIIAASKKRSIEEIQTAKELGINNFGENYFQEAERKKQAFKDVTLHMIGKLQSNKAKQAVELFDVIHTITSEKLAKKLDMHCKNIDKQLDIFIQVNIGQEPQKNGVLEENLEGLIRKIKTLTSLNLLGLMIIPPKNGDTSFYFKQAQTLTKKYGFKALSMGMSSDYKEAIENGATHIRIGTAIFGDRE